MKLANEKLEEELICSQEEYPGTHYSIREITSALSVSKTSVHRMGQRKGFSTYKRLTTSHMAKGCKQRRVEKSALLAKQFSEHSLRRFIFQDEKDFPLQISTNLQNNRVYFSGSKSDINPNRLFHEGNKFTKKCW